MPRETTNGKDSVAGLQVGVHTVHDAPHWKHTATIQVCCVLFISYVIGFDHEALEATGVRWRELCKAEQWHERKQGGDESVHGRYPECGSETTGLWQG